jgi:anhydro-N-acetylmuramic acid kinase
MPIERPHIVRERIVAGAMSGTSADGVDVAIIRTIPPYGVELLGFASIPFDAELRKSIADIRSAGSGTLRQTCEIARRVTLAYAECLRRALRHANLDAGRLDAVGAHGQTLFHDPPLTLQVFDPSLLAVETGCAVVSDFRRADLALGGQGAPLVPYADALLFADESRTRAIVNIGGIANVTILCPSRGTPGEGGVTTLDITAFDTGPGNCVSDHLARTIDPTGPGFDANGDRAARGQVDESMLQFLLADPYFARRGPKSTDGPAMIDIWQKATTGRERADGRARLPPSRWSGTLHVRMRDRESPQSRIRIGSAGASPSRLRDDALLTDDALFATAATWCADALAAAIPPDADVFVAGGGTKNRAIMARLRARFPSLKLTDDLGIPSSAREAIAFALLAAATLDGVPGNIPSVTGASRAVVLGSITNPSGGRQL